MISARFIPVVTTAHVRNLGSVIAKKVGEVFSATKTSISAPTTSLAKTEPHVSILNLARILASAPLALAVPTVR